MTTSAPPLRLVATVLHLAVYGTIGIGILSAFFALLATGIGLLPVLGFGLVILVGLVYALYGLAWFEIARVNGLYRLDAAPLAMRRPVQRGFAGWLKSLLAQLKNGRMWWAAASFALSVLLGALLVGTVQTLLDSLVLLITPGAATNWLTLILPAGSDGSSSVLLAIGGAVLSLGLMVGLALLHRVIATAIIGSQAREERLEAQVQQSSQQRAGAVRAADVERIRIERDLHDGVQPRLVSVGMTLGLAQQQIDQDPRAAKELIAEAHTSTKAAITELRQLARGIHASVLDDRGLDAALSALAGRSHIPVALDVRLTGRVDRDAESAVYFVVAESLTNAAKHSRASECRVAVRLRDTDPDPAEGPARVLWARVEDNGIGGAQVQPGGGLDGLTNRVLAAGGTIRIESPQGGPTAVEVSVPCAS
ncbi:histidine kinase [Leucobacter tardus]|uniref:histidine kinase n=1 Tax=Leucobacter tardus TaxID=501483 RepID=A0A939QMS5_9MICO|nr:histidine kinase [Leucobacter tardus]MBO2990786.1 sensor domain-containing protein [Leucobacter tardus]